MWPDQQGEEVEHELQDLKPAPNPGEKLKFGDEEVTVVKYINLGENVIIERPRQNIPKKATVTFCMS